MSFGPWAPNLPELERTYSLRVLRAIALTLFGPSAPIVEALRQAEADPAASDRARLMLAGMAALPKRRLIALYAEVVAPARRGQR